MIKFPRSHRRFMFRCNLAPVSGCCVENAAKSMNSKNLSQPRKGRCCVSQHCHSLVAALVLCALASCAESPIPSRSAAPLVSKSELAPAVAVAPPRPASAPGRLVPARHPPVPVVAKKLPNLVGLSQPAAIAQMGKPDSIETQGAAQTMIWRAGVCSLRVSFFLDVTSNQRFALSQSLSPDHINPSLCAQRIAVRANP